MKSEEWGEIVSYINGWCYGIAPNGQTICLGRTAYVKSLLEDPGLKTGNHIVQGIIDQERQLQNEREVENGRSGNVEAKSSSGKRPVKTGGIRARPATNAKHKPVNTGRTQAKQGVPSC